MVCLPSARMPDEPEYPQTDYYSKREVAATDEPLVPFTCPWAQDGLRRAMDGLTAASSGVEGYGVGSRHLRYKSVGDQSVAVDYWMKMVEYYCGIDALPTALTGRDTAFRVIPRDV